MEEKKFTCKCASDVFSAGVDFAKASDAAFDRKVDAITFSNELISDLEDVRKSCGIDTAREKAQVEEAIRKLEDDRYMEGYDKITGAWGQFVGKLQECRITYPV